MLLAAVHSTSSTRIVCQQGVHLCLMVGIDTKGKIAALLWAHGVCKPQWGAEGEKVTWGKLVPRI